MRLEGAAVIHEAKPMKPVLPILTLVLLAATPAGARSYRAGLVEVVDPWTRPAAAAAMGVGYLGLVNHGTVPVTLLSAQSPAARTVSLHQTRVTDGVARMAPMPGGLTIPAGGTIALSPGGYHLMLEGLSKPLTAGATAPLTLRFSNGARAAVDLVVQVQPPAAAAPGMEHAHH
jgi:copper(I)-binding protein